jgi:hypothetical protein
MNEINSELKLSREHISIMEHSSTRAAGGLYYGDSKEMKELCALGLMQSMGKKSFVPDEYFALTTEGKSYLAGITL